MKFIYATGGREKYYKATNVGDCVTRAICNATGKDYKEVYDRLKEMAKCESTKNHRGNKRSSVRDGVFKETWKRYLKEIGWVHHSVTSIGNKERRMKLTEEDLPNGTLIVQLSKHLTCVKDKVIYDTYDCSTKEYYDEFGNLQVNNQRCVYGYWTAPSEEEIKKEQGQKEAAEQLKAKEEASIKALKEAIKAVDVKYAGDLLKYENQIKKLNHEYKILVNRKNREIKKLKEQHSGQFLNTVLSN